MHRWWTSCQQEHDSSDLKFLMDMPRFFGFREILESITFILGYPSLFWEANVLNFLFGEESRGFTRNKFSNPKVLIALIWIILLP